MKPEDIHNPPQRQQSRGQIVVEYVLLLIVGVTLAVMIVTLMVSRNPDSPGLVVQKWRQILNVIGNDYPDDVSQ